MDAQMNKFEEMILMFVMCGREIQSAPEFVLSLAPAEVFRYI